MKQQCKYQSEALGVIHQDALASFSLGAISEERMRIYDEACLVQPDAPVPRISTQKPAVAAAGSGAPMYALSE